MLDEIRGGFGHSSSQGRTAVALNTASIRVSKTLFSYQIYIEADGFLVQTARRDSGLGKLDFGGRKEAASV